MALRDRPLTVSGTSSTTSRCILMVNQALFLLGSNEADLFLEFELRAYVNVIVCVQTSGRMLPCMHNNRCQSYEHAEKPSMPVVAVSRHTILHAMTMF